MLILLEKAPLTEPVVTWWVLDPILEFMTPYPEDILTNMNSEMAKQHMHYETAKIFLHLSQLPALHFVLKFN